MNICENQMNMLRMLFQKFDQNDKGYLVEKELRSLLYEFEIDKSFAPLMLRLFSCFDNNEQIVKVESKRITFDNFISFFKILISGDKKSFLNLIFTAVDQDRNGKIGVDELIEFSALIGDSLTEQEAKLILRDCSKKNKLQQAMNNTKVQNKPYMNSHKNRKQDEIGTHDDSFPCSCSAYSLNEDAKHKLERSLSHRSFHTESKSFVLNDIDFEQLWNCYS